MIIDMHSHLGDILYPGGKHLIWKKGVVMKKIHDPQKDNEKLLMRNFGLGRLIYPLMKKQATLAQRARNATATLENLGKSLDDAGIDYTVCMPIAPHVFFRDLAEAAKADSRIIPFTSVDFTKQHDIGKKLSEDVSNGAMGLKLHPIIQRVSLTDERTLKAVESFAVYQKPVLTHAGKSYYYLGDESYRNIPENGEIRYVEKIVRTFPNVTFIVGHAGLFWQNQVRKYLGDCKNVYVDTSFQSPGNIKKLIRTFGPERVVYASDWPWGSRPPHIRTVKSACKGDPVIEKMIFHENAARLLGMNS